MPRKTETGKGGTWDSRPNPFGGKDVPHIAPELAEVAGLGRVFDLVLRAGCALMLGHTRDGGAVCFTVLDGDNRHRTYAGNVHDLEQAIESLAAAYEDL